MRKYNWIGLVIILIGVAVLLDNLDVIQGINVWHLIVPCLLILGGVGSMTSARRVHFWGCLLLLGGLYWLLVELNVLPSVSWQIVVPAAIILVGLGIFLPTYGRRSEDCNTDGFVSSTAIFGGDERRLAGAAFTGANITAIFGGVELDFTGFESLHSPAQIDITTVFGGVDLTLPAGWRVERKGLTCIFGGLGFKGHPAAGDADKVIELTGLCLFGGVDIKYL